MASDVLDKGEDAATGDLDALKYLLMGFSAIALVGGVAIGAFYTLGQNLGGAARGLVSEATSGAANSASSAASSVGYGGGN